MSIFNWSQTAASNANADPTINWAEGQAPSTINDSARAMMAALAKWVADISGATLAGGTNTAYTVASYSGFTSFAQLNNQVIGFTPSQTNGVSGSTPAVTLNVDGLGAKPLRSAPNIDIPAGSLIQGTPYVAIYNAVNGEFYLQGFYSSPSVIPIGAGVDFWGTTVPNSSFVFPYGQAISRTVYASLFSMFGTTYGTGDGSTTFNIPDLRGRVAVCLDNMGGTAAGRLTTASMSSATTLGGNGGSETHTLTVSEMPSHNHGVNDPGHTHSHNAQIYSYNTNTTGGNVPLSTAGGATINPATTGVSIQNNGGGNPHVIVQPTIVCNYIMRII